MQMQIDTCSCPALLSCISFADPGFTGGLVQTAKALMAFPMYSISPSRSSGYIGRERISLHALEASGKAAAGWFR